MCAAEAFCGEHEAVMMQILPLKTSARTCDFANCIRRRSCVVISRDDQRNIKETWTTTILKKSVYWFMFPFLWCTMQSGQKAAPRSSGSRLCSKSNSHGPALTVGTQQDNEKWDPQLGTQFSIGDGEKVAGLVPRSRGAGLPSYGGSHWLRGAVLRQPKM